MRTLAAALVLAALIAPPAVGRQHDRHTVSAFYYPWFGLPGPGATYEHWAQYGHTPPKDIDSSYYPEAGLYSSSDATTLTRQMDEIASAGIDQIVVSWWGQGSIEDQRLPMVVEAARKRGITVAVHDEPYPGRTVASVSSDLQYLGVLGIRTVYIYDPFVLAPADWAELNDRLHSSGVQVFAQTAFVGQAVAGHFDGVYTYDTLIWTGARLARFCTQAHAKGLLCAPSVGPGYDASRATGDMRVKSRRHGRTYDSMWRAAIAAKADAVTVTSYNEWQEGTQIEPAASSATHGGTFRYLSYDGAWGSRGPDAATAYLERTAYWAARYRS